MSKNATSFPSFRTWEESMDRMSLTPSVVDAERPKERQRKALDHRFVDDEAFAVAAASKVEGGMQMSDILARRLLAAMLSRGIRVWLCGLLILSTPPVQLAATRTQ